MEAEEMFYVEKKKVFAVARLTFIDRDYREIARLTHRSKTHVRAVINGKVYDHSFIGEAVKTYIEKGRHQSGVIRELLRVLPSRLHYRKSKLKWNPKEVEAYAKGFRDCLYACEKHLKN